MQISSDSHNYNQQTVLTIYAHADDEVLPAAGTLNLMSKAGWNVRCLILTDGSLSSSAVKGTRHQEAEAAGKIIGANYEFYALEECNFSTQAVIKVAEEAVKYWQPNLIITHAPQPEKYGHRDHEVCSIAVSNVATRKNIPLWYSAPPVFLRGFEPNFFVDITSVIEEKIAAIGCYESETSKVFMQLDAILVLSRFWARELGQMEGYFEAFEISRQWVNANFFNAMANISAQKISS
ncbi:PIG-L deacetylase family protein [Nostoc sp. 106C]|uniref:PIG-L deacetylase family protein n=1 Tax=Nostoc sp. 106C TaxID=1932667 RepID=UPI000A3AB4B7|nr:PIG-L deacetylase family protein [Nostoc sp. 106C]OUL18385.1 LmbE family protein [Nostoc sp. RF31YmG]OUL19110.1 LmbE family protein [Nostoc sp. 106C]